MRLPTDALTPEEIRTRVLYLDADVLVFDKPAGLPVHYGTKVERHLEQHLGALAFDRPEPPRLAHRLDKDTSGCLILGRHDDALARLGRLLMAGQVEKTYWAVVLGPPPAAAGRIDQPLRKVAGPSGGRMTVDAAGKSAVTDFRRIAGKGDLFWLELHPRTGRTHQLRAHCASLGMPILGDRAYGLPFQTTTVLHLHARAVRFAWRPDSPPIVVTAPLPLPMRAMFDRLGFDAAWAAEPAGKDSDRLPGG